MADDDVNALATPVVASTNATSVGTPLNAAPVPTLAAEAPAAASFLLEPVPDARRTLVLAACLMGTFMAAVESTIVATAMPTIVGDLRGFNLFSWVFTVYLLTQAVSIPIYGRLADLYGRKRMFFAGAGLFMIGSALCGLSSSMVQLIFFRALQGFGGGGVQPVAMTILGDNYSPSERARVQGVVASVFGVSAVLGPSLGAFLVEQVNWEFVFWVNLPVGAAAMTMIGLFLHEDIRPRQRRIDWLGSLLMMLSVSVLMLALVQGATLPRGTLIAMVGGGLAALLLLILHERATKEPMLPLELWHHRVIVVGSVGGGLAGAVMMGVAAFLPTYVQGAMGQTATVAGLVLGAMSVTWTLSSIYGGRLMVRTSYRLVAVLGSLSLVLGSALLVTLTPERGPWWATVGSLVIGVGMGMCNTAYLVSIQAIGAAAFGAVLNLTLLHRAPEAVALADHLLDPAARAELTPAMLARLTEVIAAGLHNDYLLACVLAVLCLLLACLLPARLSPRDQKLRS